MRHPQFHRRMSKCRSHYYTPLTREICRQFSESYCAALVTGYLAIFPVTVAEAAKKKDQSVSRDIHRRRGDDQQHTKNDGFFLLQKYILMMSLLSTPSSKPVKYNLYYYSI